jgi:hypothetical protein
MRDLVKSLKQRAIVKGVLDEAELYLRGYFKPFEDLSTQHFKVNNLYGIEVFRTGDDTRQSIKLPLAIITYDEEKLHILRTPIPDKRVDKILRELDQ